VTCPAVVTGCRYPSLGVSIEAAVILIAFSLRECESPAVELGDALGRIGAAISRGHDNQMGRQLGRELAVCVRSLQFHDRMVQQLAAVSNLLATLTDRGKLQVSGVGAQRWEELLAVLRARLTTGAHRELFAELLRNGSFLSLVQEEAAQPEGSVELFAD
jgi:hypothetical protein